MCQTSRAASMKFILVLVVFVCSHASTLPNNPVPKFVDGWPGGMYGLPRSISDLYNGCPSDGWLTGSRYQDMEDHKNHDAWSNPYHLYGTHSDHGITQGFCMKSNPEGSLWPAGDYCIYKYKGASCPAGFESGSIFFDDEDHHEHNNEDGTLPDGTYGHNTEYHYCCRSDSAQEMVLPTREEFFLFPHSNKCQKVKGMSSTMEWTHFDTEDDNDDTKASGNHPYVDTWSGGNIKVYYCYYV